MHSLCLHVAAIAAVAVAGIHALPTAGPRSRVYKYVATFSIDGFHSSDVGKYVALRPESTIAQLLETGYEYTNAYTSAPSDSFPGASAQWTGASPRLTNIYYDDSYDFAFYAPGSNCTGPPGAEIQYTEFLDYNSTELFSGGINPANLPQKIVNGTCAQIYPHQRLGVNTVFEIAHAAGLVTAYADKHPAYDLMRGPSGTGLSTGYFPEINAIANTVNATITYDKLHVAAFLDWINGIDPAHAEGSVNGKTANLFGGNFQAVSVGEKTAGYLNATGFPFSAPLLQAIDFVDTSLGQIVAALQAKGIYDDTLIIVASKHGQAPIDPAKLDKIDDAAINNATSVAIAQVTADDVALMWLADRKDTAKAAADLQAHASELKIKNLFWGEKLIAAGFGNPAINTATPNIFIEPVDGVIYTTSASKLEEHGGFHKDDRNVACFVSSPMLKKRVVTTKTTTRSVATTMLKALGLDVGALEGAAKEGTPLLEGFETEDE